MDCWWHTQQHNSAGIWTSFDYLTITESAPKITAASNPSCTSASFNLSMRARLMRSLLKNRSTDVLCKIKPRKVNYPVQWQFSPPYPNLIFIDKLLHWHRLLSVTNIHVDEPVISQILIAGSGSRYAQPDKTDIVPTNCSYGMAMNTSPGNTRACECSFVSATSMFPSDKWAVFLWIPVPENLQNLLEITGVTPRTQRLASVKDCSIMTVGVITSNVGRAMGCAT